ncbi:MAG: hypothetical protein PHU85_07860 [Phycisphaerae bacterium]|nr:hypothetical protein [Phycisphaerae bacterium]
MRVARESSALMPSRSTAMGTTVVLPSGSMTLRLNEPLTGVRARPAALRAAAGLETVLAAVKEVARVRPWP